MHYSEGLVMPAIVLLTLKKYAHKHAQNTTFGQFAAASLLRLTGWFHIHMFLFSSENLPTVPSAYASSSPIVPFIPAGASHRWDTASRSSVLYTSPGPSSPERRYPAWGCQQREKIGSRSHLREVHRQLHQGSTKCYNM